jgi:hypothetical protein
LVDVFAKNPQNAVFATFSVTIHGCIIFTAISFSTRVIFARLLVSDLTRAPDFAVRRLDVLVEARTVAAEPPPPPRGEELSRRRV